MGTFALTILGASGGPMEIGNQSVMIAKAGPERAKNWICVDAGSGLHQIKEMLAQSREANRLGINQHECMEEEIESLYESEYEPLGLFMDERSDVVRGLDTLDDTQLSKSLLSESIEVFNRIREYYITHAHLDHVAALVINTPAIRSTEKKVFALPRTAEALRTHIFNDSVWPDLLNEDSFLLNLQELQELRRHTVACISGWYVTPFRVNHGVTVRNRLPYYSTAFLIGDEPSGDAILVCGDLDSDLLSKQQFLAAMWLHLAQTVPFDNLKGILIECSSTNSTQNECLYGHLSPRFLVHELKQLSRAYNRPLDGLQVIIHHVKIGPGMRDPRLVILDEVRSLAASEALGDVAFSIGIQGYTFVL
ncbi:LAMI_0D01618g1_1 [Lachancea mirantina]|uniref:LAMI_0D01618g1_1 n=1 Tax=Lachancea mirantina TaxID=1230905 RepID=A0A1G4J8R0_9SACH|nr:LAMI_0D01618g1_1 [Lachancea mirantina]